ncbi:MAG: DNA polymerase III subunit delta [bacterium]|nr:DNA polymerase III subunit delta [bacterium]
MIYFVYGNDTYRLKKTVDAMREKYEDSSGMNSCVFDGNYDIEKIRSDVMSLPFLADKRLVIIKNILGAKGIDGKKMIEILDKKPDSTVMLFIEEGEPDKRTSLFKRLMKEKSKELNLLQGGELLKWIKAEAEKNGGTIETKEANMLAGYYGGDLWQLKNEIQKLISYDKKITEESIDKLSVANVNVKIFDLTDAITAKNREKAFKILSDLLDSGENEMYILSMIQWQVRNLALVYDLKDSNERDIASKAKMNPYIVKKTLSATRKIESLDTIKAYYGLIIGAENDIKTGVKDPDISLELLVNKLTD